MLYCRDRTCCLRGQEDLPPWEEQNVRTRMRHRLMPLIWDRVDFFGVGGGRGYELMAAEYLLKVRDEFKRNIRIISVLPYPEYREEWPEEDFRRQEEILRRSDKVVFACPAKTADAWQIRDRKLLEESGFCICYCRRADGRIAGFIREARQCGMTVYNACSWDLRQLGRQKNRTDDYGRRIRLNG